MFVHDGFDLARPFTRAQAHAHGLTRSALRHLVADGLVRQVMSDVYVDSAARDSIDLRAQALALVAPLHSVVCDRTAAWLHGADLQVVQNPLWLPPLEVFRADGHGGLRRGQCERGKRTLLPGDIVELSGLAVTTPLRTALDLGRLSRRPDAFGALNALARLGNVDRATLAAEVPRFWGMRGVVQLRSLVPLADPRLESPGESRTLLQLIDAGLPHPTPQFRIFDEFGLELYRIDFAYEDERVGLEYNGRAWHTAPEHVQRDRARRAYLESLGWVIIELTSDDVYGPNPRAVSIVRQALRDATR